MNLLSLRASIKEDLKNFSVKIVLTRCLLSNNYNPLTMKNLQIIIWCIVLQIVLNNSFVLAQADRMAINTSGATAHPSAILDISSTEAGLLIPRLNTSQRTAIVAPANGLLVFDTDINHFLFFNGSVWINIDTDTHRGIDDTPVNGEVTESITSNWAFDHDADANAHHTPPTSLPPCSGIHTIRFPYLAACACC